MIYLLSCACTLCVTLLSLYLGKQPFSLIPLLDVFFSLFSCIRSSTLFVLVIGVLFLTSVLLLSFL